MKFNSELPKCMFDQNIHLNDYDFVLFHLYLKDESYRNYYKELRKNHRNRVMILDNSAYEFFVSGEVLDLVKFSEAIHELVPDYYILPDVLMDKNATIEKTKEFLYKYGVPSNPMAVVQGNSESEMLECIWIYKAMGIDSIAIPFHNSFFKSIIPSTDILNQFISKYHYINDDLKYAMGRIEFIKNNIENIIDMFGYVHILGSHCPYEAKWYESYEIDSMDTGYPVKLGVAGVEYGMEKNKPNIIIDEFFDHELSNDTMELIIRNINTMKSDASK